MAKGVIAALDQHNGQDFAALLSGGRLVDLIVSSNSDIPVPEEIYLAKAGQAMKGQNGLLVDLGDGHKGFLKGAKGISPGSLFQVQVSSFAESSKAPPVSLKPELKSRYVIITPNSPGLNIARKIKDDDLRDELDLMLKETCADRAKELGVIVRSNAQNAPLEDVEADLVTMLEIAQRLLDDKTTSPGLLIDAPDIATLAWRDWAQANPREWVDEVGCFEGLGVWDQIEKLRQAEVSLGTNGSMIIEQTSALVAVDINTGADFSLTAGLNANLAAVKALPSQLSMRGLGGQIVIDFAPLAKKDRRKVETAMQSAFRNDLIDTVLVGWTPLGHYELQRKRARIPLSTLLNPNFDR